MQRQLASSKSATKNGEDNSEYGDSSVTFGSAKEPREKSQNKRAWIWYTLATTIAFTFCNLSICVLTNQTGICGFLYFQTGTIWAGIVYFIRGRYLQFKETRKCWPPAKTLNIKVDGKVNCVNLLAFVCFCLIYEINQMFPFMTMYFAQKASLNKGVVAILWSINPLFIAIYDQIFYK